MDARGLFYPILFVPKSISLHFEMAAASCGRQP
jgi:hypothetical protein